MVLNDQCLHLQNDNNGKTMAMMVWQWIVNSNGERTILFGLVFLFFKKKIRDVYRHHNRVHMTILAIRLWLCRRCTLICTCNLYAQFVAETEWRREREREREREGKSKRDRELESEREGDSKWDERRNESRQQSMTMANHKLTSLDTKLFVCVCVCVFMYGYSFLSMFAPDTWAKFLRWSI